MVAQLSEQEKTSIFKEDTKKTVAILLHEFAQPTGISHRHFDTSHALSKSLIKSPGFRGVMRQFLLLDCYLDTANGLRTMDSVRYIMTPRKSETYRISTQTAMAIKEHIRLAFKPNLAQLFLGSYMVSMHQLDAKWIEVTITNETSRNSLFLHIPSSTYKPNIFGTVSQSFKLILPIKNFR